VSGRGWEFAENPAFAGQEPRPLVADCHDGSPFLTVVCGCGYEMHIHETQIAGVPAGATIATRCHDCGRLLSFGGELPRAFAEMREAGWFE
jgi:hypothetical protein